MSIESEGVRRFESVSRSPLRCTSCPCLSKVYHPTPLVSKPVVNDLSVGEANLAQIGGARFVEGKGQPIR